MAFSIGMVSEKLIYCHTASMTFDGAGYKHINFAQDLPIENAIKLSLKFDGANAGICLLSALI